MLTNVEFDVNAKFHRSKNIKKKLKIIIYLIFVVLSVDLFLYLILINRKINKNLSINLANNNILINFRNELFKKVENLDLILKSKVK